MITLPKGKEPISNESESEKKAYLVFKGKNAERIKAIAKQLNVSLADLAEWVLTTLEELLAEQAEQQPKQQPEQQPEQQ